MICTYGASLFSIFPSWRHSLLAAWPGAQVKLRRAQTRNLLRLSYQPSSFASVTVMQGSGMEASGDQGLQRPAGHADHDERGHPAPAALAAHACTHCQGTLPAAAQGCPHPCGRRREHHPGGGGTGQLPGEVPGISAQRTHSTAAPGTARQALLSGTIGVWTASPSSKMTTGV